MFLPRDGRRVAKIGTPTSRRPRPQILRRGGVVKLGSFAKGFDLARGVLNCRVVDGLTLSPVEGEVSKEDTL